MFSRVKIKTRIILAITIMLLFVLVVAGFSAAQILEIALFDLDPLRTLTIITMTALLVGLLMIISLTGSIVKPLIFLLDAAHDIDGGDLNVHLKTDSKDELGELTNAFGRMIGTLNSLTNDLEFMAVAQSEGVTHIRVNSKKYKGTYNELTTLVNDMVAEHNDITSTAINTVLAIAAGDFEAQAPMFPGDKAVLNETIERLRENIRSIYNEISRLVYDASGGKLDSRADKSLFEGGWRELTTQLNDLMNAMTDPINETILVLEKIAAGNLRMRMSGDYKGDFHKIMECVNFMGEEISGYIKETAEILEMMSAGDYSPEISRNYIGDFARLKDSINKILEDLNRDFYNMQSMAGNLSTSTKQISEASMKLAEGATEQTAAVNSLTGIITNYREISEKIVDNAYSADELLKDINEKAMEGNKEMKRLTTAMNDINQSSANIVAINKVIEDIAFQTNLLALNASVEAARAGEHGKGFAVVAEEVRNLANRSGAAAKETTETIQSSVEKASGGTKITNSMAIMLDSMAQEINQALTIMSEIAAASRGQTSKGDQITNINENTKNILAVTLANANASEETAATSEELASQAELLNATLARYQLRYTSVK